MYLGDLTVSDVLKHSVMTNKVLTNGVRPDEPSEVGSPHIVAAKRMKVRGAKGVTSQLNLQQNMQGTGRPLLSMENELRDLRYLSRTYAQVQTLMPRINEHALKYEHRKQERNKASGVDGVTKDEYGENLDANVADLIKRMKAFSYRPNPVRRTYIPKANGNMRPLGIPSYEDKLVQGVMAGILSDIYEERFYDSSYGFRPNRSAHDAVRYVSHIITTHKVNYVLEADIKGFFDNVDHDWLMKFLAHDIADKNFLRYIKRFLIGGVLEGTERKESDKGTPQGGLISPVLANVYLHYVLDLWVERVLKNELRGEVYYVRYADDFVLMFQYENEAKSVLEELRARLGKFNLEVAEDKTRILPMGRFKGTKEDFDFLGFTFYNMKSKQDKYMAGVRTSKKRLKVKEQAVKKWLKGRRTKPVAETIKRMGIALKGHYNYYGVSGNTRMLDKFHEYVKYACFRMLNRRDQKGKFRYDKFLRVWEFYVPLPRLTVNIWNM